jgi:hypothetical protein
VQMRHRFSLPLPPRDETVSDRSDPEYLTCL